MVRKTWHSLNVSDIFLFCFLLSPSSNKESGSIDDKYLGYKRTSGAQRSGLCVPLPVYQLILFLLNLVLLSRPHSFRSVSTCEFLRWKMGGREEKMQRERKRPIWAFRTNNSLFWSSRLKTPHYRFWRCLCSFFRYFPGLFVQENFTKYTFK